MAKLIIKEILKQRGLQNAEIAKKIGRTASAFSVATRADGNPTLSQLEKIANAIGCKISDLIDEEKDLTLVCPHCGRKLRITLTEDDTQ